MLEKGWEVKTDPDTLFFDFKTSKKYENKSNGYDLFGS
jgi:hypothetical protein